MRAKFSDRVERGRQRAFRGIPSAHGDNYGVFDLHTNAGAPIRIILSAGQEAIPWEHVSVSLTNRCPTWEEMSWVKGLFFEDEEVVVQYHPRKSDYVNHHPYCLHLWRPTRDVMPTPPPITVGPRTDAEHALADLLHNPALR